MILFKRRPDDKCVAKYFLPYGYMRRHLARAYGFVVRGGEFVKGPVVYTDTTGFHWQDVLPLGVVMAMQSRRRHVPNEGGHARQVAELQRCIVKLRADLREYQKSSAAEIERLSVENMRLRLQLRGR